MPPKKSSGLGAALQPLDVNQETLHEARSQKRKATSPTPQEEELDQEIRDLEAIHQQVQKKKEKLLRLADLQRKIDEAAEEMCHLTQDDQDRRPQHRECWGFVLKCYELRTRQHKMLNVNVLRPWNNIPMRIMNHGWRLMRI
jgi:DNA repair exonuclease SbcCD ATPase subunit